MNEKHNLLAEEVRSQIKSFYLAKKPAKIYHGGTNSTRPFDFKKGEVVDVSKLNNVLEINSEERYALVESNVSMRKLVEATLKYNLIPPVVMEFSEITVGGGIQGGAGESSSFKWGLFHNICMEYEIILGDGEMIKVSPEENVDLFYGTAGSYGSLGVITTVKIKLIPAKKFVELSYYPVYNFSIAAELIKNYSVDREVEYLDGIMFSENSGVIMTGKLTDQKNLPISKFLRAQDDWFYLHAKKIIKNNEPRKEIIPIRDYLFRYDRGAFWMGIFSFKILKIHFDKFTRFVFNIFLNTKTLYRSLHATNLSGRYIIQDFCLPFEKAPEFFKFSNDDLKIYPIWLCPLKTDNQAKLLPTHLNDLTCLNVGIYGEPKNKSDIVKLSQDLENKAKSLSGRKWFYAHTYYFREEFWQIYDLPWYTELRKKYSAETVFPDIYDKVHMKEKIQASITKGIFRFLKSPFKLNN